MDRFAKMLAGLVGRSARLLPPARRDWAEAVLAEAGEVPSGLARVAWLGGGLWLLTREVLMRAVRVLAFAAVAAGVVWAGWPGSSSNSAVPLNRMYVVVTVVALAVLPAVVRRYYGPARSGWRPGAARLGGYAMVLALIAAKTVKDRLGSKLGFYFAIAPGEWVLQVVLLLLVLAYVAGLLILTSQRSVRLARGTLPAVTGLGAVTGGVVYALNPFGVPGSDNSASGNWWWLAALLPLATGYLAARLSARDTRPAALGPVQQSALAAACATTTAALLLAALTSVAIALLPHHVPGQADARNSGVCQTCDPDRTVIPPGLRPEYQAEISVGQAGTLPLASLLVAPFFGAWVGVIGGGLARRRPGTTRRVAGGPYAVSPPPPGRLMAADADRDQAVSTLTAGFAQGRLTREELDLRAGQALAARTGAELAALTADLPAVLTSARPGRRPAGTGPPRASGKAVTWCAWGLVAPVLFTLAGTLIPDPTPTNNEPIGKIVFLLILVYFVSWLVIGAQMLATWYQQRSRPGAGRHLAEPSPPAASK
jgi:Domain of unknown function (DUF1707)